MIETGVAPCNLELELTEGILIADIEDAAAKMKALSDMGVRVSIDDFGTGYSSLQYLKKLHLDTLKIDQSFVRDITADSSSAAIVGTIIAMARHLELDVIAEGVETYEELGYLIGQGCHVFQGFYFSRPLPHEAFIERLTQEQNNPTASAHGG